MRRTHAPTVGAASTAVPKKRHRPWVYLIIALCLAVFVAANVVLIFYFSTESKEESADRSNSLSDVLVDLLFPNYDSLSNRERADLSIFTRKVVRKAAHFCEFALLGFLSGWLMLHLNSRQRRVKRWMTWLFPAAFCLFCGALDETLQIFTHRGSDVRDTAIDFAGAVLGLLLIQFIFGIICLIRLIRRRCAERRRAEKCRRAEKKEHPCKPPTTD